MLARAEMLSAMARRAALALLAGLALTGAALAEPRDGGGSDSQADCVQRATVAFSIANAQCAAYPGGSEASNYCYSAAAQAYGQAIAQCSAGAAAAHVGGAGKLGAFGGRNRMSLGQTHAHLPAARFTLR